MSTIQLRQRQARFGSSLSDDAAFVSLLAAYRATGGLVRGEDVAEYLCRQGGDGFGALARRIAASEVVHFRWESIIWLPLFQFERPTLSVRPEVQDVLAELRSVLDNREVTLWFVTPNAWIEGRRPVDLVKSGSFELHCAARADRFVATG